MEKAVLKIPEKAPKKKYKTPMSLWFVEKTHLSSTNSFSPLAAYFFLHKQIAVS